MEKLKIIIRDFQFKDLQGITTLNIQLGYSTTESEMNKRMNIILKNSNYKTFVASLDNKVVAYIGLINNYFWEQNGHFIKIQALVTHEEFRKNGIGKLLMQSAEQWGKEIGAKLSVLNCGNKEEREAAHKFYSKIGFEAKSLGYIKQLNSNE